MAALALTAKAMRPFQFHPVHLRFDGGVQVPARLLRLLGA
jgi:hypothetical protein